MIYFVLTSSVFTDNLLWQVEYPVYWSVVEWCEGFKHLLDCLDVDRAHILGVSVSPA